MQTALRRKTETGNEKDPSAALGMTKRERHISHSFSLRYGSQPPALRATSFQRKEGECLFPASSFRAKARNLFRSRSGEAVRSAGNGKHRASCDLGVRRLMQTALRRKTETGDEKDPSAALGMTKRGGTSHIVFQSHSGSQPPPLRGTSFRRKEGECARNRAAISRTSPFGMV